ncbi:MAG: FHA domain-containing protein, partial [Acidimicrobiales bacterium]
DLVGGAPVRPLALMDAQGTVSPTHAVIHLEEWEVSITDEGSLYGTHVWMPGTTEWVRLNAGQTVALQPRSHVRLGARELTFEPVNRR